MKMPDRLRKATKEHKKSKNAGPKGVLNDYKQFKKQQAVEVRYLKNEFTIE